MEVTHLVADWMSEAGLNVTFDKWGNLYGRTSKRDHGPYILTGSHLDSVPNGGNYDGVLGVLSSLEAVLMLVESKTELAKPVQVVAFIEEEGSQFEMMLGSRLATGQINPATMKVIANNHGERFTDLLQRAQFHYPVDPDIDLRQGIDCYLELHIEQGKRLERAEIPVGVVTSIAGPYYYEVTLVGQPDHAGTTEYNDRKDTLLAASEIIGEVNALAKQDFKDVARMTVGNISVEPNAKNVIAGQTTIIIDTRSAEQKVASQVQDSLKAMVRKVAQSHQLDYSFNQVLKVIPAIVPDYLIGAIIQGCKKADIEYMELVSWAAHDAQTIANITDIGMIFVPCQDGRSHCPEEYVSPHDIANGIATLANTLLELVKS